MFPIKLVLNPFAYVTDPHIPCPQLGSMKIKSGPYRAQPLGVVGGKPYPRPPPVVAPLIVYRWENSTGVTFLLTKICGLWIDERRKARLLVRGIPSYPDCMICILQS